MDKLKLLHYGIDPDIVMPETHIFTLCVENKAFLLRLLSELRWQAVDGKEGDFSLVLNERCLNIEKSVSVVFDFTDIDFNSKQITNLLTKKFAEFLGLGEQAENLTNLENIVLNFVEDFRINSGLNIEYDTGMSGNNLAKICALKIADDKKSLLERLAEYVNLMCDLKPIKLLVLVFGKEFLLEEDTAKLYKHCFDHNVRLMFIEGNDSTKILPNERRLIIDEDLCTITQGYGEFD